MIQNIIFLIFFFNDICENPNFHFRRAVWLRAKEKYSESLETFEDILKHKYLPLHLTEDDILYQIAYTYQLMNQLEKAQNLYNDLYQRNPNKIYFFYQYCWLMLLTNYDNNNFGIVENLIKGTKLFNLKDQFLIFILGIIDRKRNNLTSAYQYLRECLTGYGSNEPLFWFNIGILYFNSQQIQDAIIAFQRTLYLNKLTYKAWIYLGFIYKSQQDPESAKKIFGCSYQTCHNNYFIFEAQKSCYMQKSIHQLKFIDTLDFQSIIQFPQRFAHNYVYNLFDEIMEKTEENQPSSSLIDNNQDKNEIIEIRKENKIIKAVMKSIQIENNEINQKLINEYKMIQHPNILKTYGIFFGDNEFPQSILIEYCPTNLEEAVKTKKFSKVQLVYLIYQITEGMKYLHSHSIIHQKLNPSNILISEDGTIKICIGCTTNENTCTKYIAPEILNGKQNDEKADVYSFGVIVYFMLSDGQFPDSGNTPPFPLLAQLLLKECLSENANDRPSFENISDLLEKNKSVLVLFTQEEVVELSDLISKFKTQIPVDTK